MGYTEHNAQLNVDSSYQDWEENLHHYIRLFTQQWRRYGWIFLALWKIAFQCGHNHAIPGEGKSFCPDCGEGIVYRWHIMRCAGCNSRRDAQYRLRRWVPLYSYCPYCGERDVAEETLENPRYHHLNKAYLVAIPAREFEKHIQSYFPEYQTDSSSQKQLRFLLTNH